MSDTLLDTILETRNAAIAQRFPGIDYDQYVVGTLGDRATRYAAHIASMDISPDMVAWALGMRARYKTPYVKVHHFIADWTTALLILTHGEECDPARCTDGSGWPMAFTATHAARAMQLLAGENWPANVFTLLPAEG